MFPGIASLSRSSGRTERLLAVGIRTLDSVLTRVRHERVFSGSLRCCFLQALNQLCILVLKFGSVGLLNPLKTRQYPEQ